MGIKELHQRTSCLQKIHQAQSGAFPDVVYILLISYTYHQYSRSMKANFLGSVECECQFIDNVFRHACVYLTSKLDEPTRKTILAGFPHEIVGVNGNAM